MKNRKTRRKMSGGTHPPGINEYYIYRYTDDVTNEDKDVILIITDIISKGKFVSIIDRAAPKKGIPSMSIREFDEGIRDGFILGPLDEDDKDKRDIQELIEKYLKRKQEGVAPPTPPAPPPQDPPPPPPTPPATHPLEVAPSKETVIDIALDANDVEAVIPRILQFGRDNPIIQSLSKIKNYEHSGIDTLTSLFKTINKFTIRINEASTSTDDTNSLFAVIKRDGEDVTLTFKKDGKNLNNGETSKENTEKHGIVPLLRPPNIYHVRRFTEFLSNYFKSTIEESEATQEKVRAR